MKVKLLTIVVLALLLCATVPITAAAKAPSYTQTESPIRVASVGGAGQGVVIINAHTGWFVCVAKVRFNHGTTNYLQYHRTGMTGATVVRKGVANITMGIVVITETSVVDNLALSRNQANLLSGRSCYSTCKLEQKRLSASFSKHESESHIRPILYIHIIHILRQWMLVVLPINATHAVRHYIRPI